MDFLGIKHFSASIFTLKTLFEMYLFGFPLHWATRNINRKLRGHSAKVPRLRTHPRRTAGSFTENTGSKTQMCPSEGVSGDRNCFIVNGRARLNQPVIESIHNHHRWIHQ